MAIHLRSSAKVALLLYMLLRAIKGGVEVDRERYFFGGYLVTQRVARPEAMSAELLPARLLTASSCIATFVPDAWTLDWVNVTDEQRQKEGAALGLDPATLSMLRSHVTAGFDEGKFGWPNVVKSSDALSGLLELLPRSREWVALGLALHRNHAGEFLEENAPSEGLGSSGVYDVLVKRTSPPAGGVFLGFELLGFEHGGDPHSWLCNGLEEECFQTLGIRPNANGFLQTESEAERAAAHISRDDVGSEPVRWLPWMILDFTGRTSLSPRAERTGSASVGSGQVLP